MQLGMSSHQTDFCCLLLHLRQQDMCDYGNMLSTLLSVQYVARRPEKMMTASQPANQAPPSLQHLRQTRLHRMPYRQLSRARMRRHTRHHSICSSLSFTSEVSAGVADLAALWHSIHQETITTDISRPCTSSTALNTYPKMLSLPYSLRRRAVCPPKLGVDSNTCRCCHSAACFCRRCWCALWFRYLVTTSAVSCIFGDERNSSFANLWASNDDLPSSLPTLTFGVLLSPKQVHPAYWHRFQSV